MTKLWENGKESEIVQETRGWDEVKQKTFSQRKKEGSADYRYFPDPDLPKMKLHEAFDLEKMKKELPELPEQKRARYKKDFGIKDEDIEVYINSNIYGNFFEAVSKNLKFDKERIKLASNFITNDLIGLKEFSTKEVVPEVEGFTELVGMFGDGKISSRVAKHLLQLITTREKGNSPIKIATEKNLLQKNDEGALKKIVQKIINENPEPVASYKNGKENAIMSLVGKIIKESNGSANPQIVIKLLKEML
jgi:aspartyl-tRNA(Asn)/glutamyl-tRNA(Gln) amidotransferase subunit B